MRLSTVHIISSISGIICTVGLAQTTQPSLTASLGFNGIFKPDSWTPVFVTIADPTSRAGTIDVRTARGRVGNDITARIQSNATPTTFSLYAPLDPLDRVVIDWRDEKGKLVSHLNLTEKARENPAALGGPVFGVAGQIADANRVATQLIRDTGEFVAAGGIATRLLPERAIGYGSVDVLVLPEINTDAIDDAVETEIVNWVRAGGIVVTWPGAQAMPQGSPLAEATGIEMGGTVTRTIDGRETAVRDLRPLDNRTTDLSDSRTILYTRKVGLGQVSVFGFDPTTVYRSIEDRMDAFRRATGGQVSLSPDERRVGSYDPLTFQARGEEQLEVAPVARDTWLWIALALGLVIGPGEMVLLLLCRRPIVTPLTVVGLAATLGSGMALALKYDGRADRAIEIIVETDEGIVARGAISTSVPPAAASWLIGRAADPLHDVAGELSLNQRQDRLEPAMPMRALSDYRPRVRSVEVAPGKPMLLVNGPVEGPSSQAQSADDAAWEKAVVLSQDQLRPLAKSLLPSEALLVASHVRAPSPSDDPATARRETAIEALAKQAGWEPILMDRHLGSRLVRLFESESVQAIVAQRTRGDVKQFVIHLQRP